MLKLLLSTVIPYLAIEHFDYKNGKLTTKNVDKGEVLILASSSLFVFFILKNNEGLKL